LFRSKLKSPVSPYAISEFEKTTMNISTWRKSGRYVASVAGALVSRGLRSRSSSRIAAGIRRLKGCSAGAVLLAAGVTAHAATPTIVIDSHTPDPSTAGQSYAVQVSVSGGGGTATGTVTVDDGDGNNAVITLSSGTGSGTVTSATAGTKTLTASYSGDGTYDSGSVNTSHTVNKGTSTVTITSDASDPSAVGAAYTVGVTVSGAGATPTGNVTVDDGNGNQVVVALSGGSGSGSLTSTSAGSKTLTASYAGDSNYNTGSDTEAHTVSKGAATVAITSDASDPSAVGVSYTVAATVSGGGVTPTGTVTVSDGEGNSATITLSGGSGSAGLSTLTAGSKTLTATYNGDSNYNTGSDTEAHTVNKGSPTITITSDASDPSTYAQAYTVAVSVTGPGVTPTGTVSLDDGDGNVSTITLSGGTGSASVTPASAGSKTLSATYNGDANYLTDVDTEGHTVNKATPTITITSDNPDWNNVHVAVTVNFSVSVPHGGTPTGNVIVSDDSGQSVTVDVSTGTASIDCLAVGNRTITAAYQGDGNFNAASDTEAHEVRGPSITVLGNSNNIADGSTSTSSVNATHYGHSGEYPYVVTNTYTIRNDGTDTLNLTLPITITGDGAGSYTVLTQPTDVDLEPNESTTFEVKFAPEIAGNRAATVTINNDDKTKEVFDFTLGGRIIPSAIDLTYNPGVGPNQKVIDVAVQADGKAVIGGAFITYSGTSRRYVARINVDGSLDTTFDPGTGASHHVNTVDIHTGGKILVGGRFSTFDGTVVGRVARLNDDGSLDTSFQTTSGGANGEVYAVAVQSDQKILIGGVFTSVNGTGRVRIARLNADGSLDSSFNAGIGPDNRVRFIELQADGKILVGGNFRKWNGVNHSRIVRLNSDGSLDGTFSSPFPDNGYVSEIIKDESDGDIYVSGGTRRLVRLNNDGSIQWSVGLYFNSDPNAILLTQEGKIITGGYFTTFSGVARTRLARLNSDGSLDTVFDPQPGANKRFLRLAVEPNGRIIGVGEFTTYRGETRNFITRMMNDIRIAPYFSLQPATQTVEEGTVFTLASLAEGELPVDYQWYKQDGMGVYQPVADGGNISGSTSKDLVFNTVTSADAGTYKVVATNPGGSTDSVEVVITVTPNQAPTVDGLSDLALTEDDPLQTVNLTGVSNGAAHETHQTLTVTATSSDTSIIPDPTVTYTSGDATGTLTFTPVADAFTSGTPVTITITLTDDGQTDNGGVTTTVETFDITVASVNDTPTLTLTPTTFTVNEDSGAFSQAGFATFSVGPANESSQTLTLVCNNDNTALFSAQPDINDTTGELTFTPAADAYGTATVTVYAQDDGGGADTSPTRTFTIVVNPVNDQPNFTLDVSTVNFVEDSGFNQVTIVTTTSRGPANETTQKVDRYEITGNTNPGLLTGVEVSSNGILKASTVSGVTGSTVVTIQLVDNGGTSNGGVDTSATQSFTITVGPPNFPPDFDLAANLYTHLEDSGSYSVASFVSNVGPGDVSEAGQTVIFAISAADPTLFASGPTLTANGANYDLSYTLADDAAGSTLVTVTGTDDGPGTAAQNKTFTVTITEVNDEPSFALGASVTVNEDSGAYSGAGFATSVSAGPASESGQTLTFHVSNDNNALFSVQPSIDVSTGNLTFTPATNGHGSATVSVYLTDDGGVANSGDDTSPTQTFTITVTDVNDEPSFTAGANVSVFRGDGAYDAAWATALNKGAADESGQTLTFNIVANDNTGLFSAGPAIDGTTGNLSFTPSASANGTANITVELMDDGGTANGGDDTSAQVTFTITISGSQVFVDGNPSLSGDTVTVPIDLNGTGTENSVSFTLDYDATRLVFDSGSAPAGTLILNSATGGKVGVLVVLGAGTTFGAGNNNIANLVFSLASTATAGGSTLSFTSSPVLQQVTLADATIVVGTTYVGATVTLAEGTQEGDVAPRPLGNGSLSVADATAIGRFAAGLDTANNGREFQAADSAPLGSGGDGVISIADWVQNLRDVAGLDSPRALAGPTQPVLNPTSFLLRSAALSSRRLTLESDGLVAGRSATVRLILDGSGEEAGFSCSLQFDPNSLAFVSAATATGGMLIVNQQQAANGTLGVVLALPPGQTVSAGKQTLVELQFNVSVSAGAAVGIALNSSPVLEEVTDANARRLSATFFGQTFPVELPAGFAAVGVEMVGGQPRFTFGNDDGSPVTASQLNGLEVFATGDIGAATWPRLDGALVIVGGKVQIVDPNAGSGIRFYQVRRISGGNGGVQDQ
jgi:uncharacterized delta-60 repeat protein